VGMCLDLVKLVGHNASTESAALALAHGNVTRQSKFKVFSLS